jgi:hypothetical protein
MQSGRSSADLPGDESPEALREALRDVQRRLSYFEHFGTMVQDQMAAVVERAAAVAQDTETERTQLQEEVSRLQAEAESLRRQAESYQSTIDDEVNRAREQANATLRRIQEATREIVTAALSQLTTLEGEVGRSPDGTGGDARPQTVSNEPTTARAYAALDDRPSASPSLATSTADVSPASSASSTSGAARTTTRLIVRPVLSYSELMSFQQKLRGRPGVINAELGGINDEMCEVLVTHADEEAIEGSLLNIEGMDLRLTARGAGYVEVELGESGATPL